MSPMMVANAHHANKDLPKLMAVVLLWHSLLLMVVSSMPVLIQIAINADMDIFWQPTRNAINLETILVLSFQDGYQALQNHAQQPQMMLPALHVKTLLME